MRAARGLAAASGSVAAYKLMKKPDGEVVFSRPVKCELKGLDTFIAANAHTGPYPNAIKNMRFNELLPQPANPKYKLALIGETAEDAMSLARKANDNSQYFVNELFVNNHKTAFATNLKSMEHWSFINVLIQTSPNCLTRMTVRFTCETVTHPRRIQILSPPPQF